MAVRILITGGTFDKEYDEIIGKLYFKDTHMREILDLGRSKLDVKIRTLMLLDSLDMTDDDRNVILDNCKRVSESQIVITHGTDTMTDTAKVLAEASMEKTIVITGAQGISITNSKNITLEAMDSLILAALWLLHRASRMVFILP